MPVVTLNSSTISGLQYPKKGQVIYFDTKLKGFGEVPLDL